MEIRDDQVFVTLRHANGSVSSVAYLAGGDRGFPKERVEVIGGGRVGVIEDWREVDAVAVTEGPGLAGSLLVGITMAKTLAWSLHLPLVPVNHLEGHIYAAWLLDPEASWVPGQVIGVDMGIDAVGERETELLQQRCVTLRRVQHRVDQGGLAGVRTTDQVGVGTRVRLEQLSE